jgi:CHAD domain-containing protein
MATGLIGSSVRRAGALEVELKYSVGNEQTFQQLLDATTLGGFRLAPDQLLQVEDRYLDTEATTLLQAGYACRVRREHDCAPGGQDDGYLATVKGLGDASGAYHRRLEHELELPGPLLPSDWPAGSVHELVLSLCGDRPLLPLFEIRQARHRRRLYDGDLPVAELSLDRVRYYDGAEVMAVEMELEAELLPGGSREALERLAAELNGRVGLAPQPQSKFERGLALFSAKSSEDEARRASAASPAKTGEPRVDPDDAMSEAGRKTFRIHFQEMIYHEPGTRRGEDAEALHDMRVATRRMRAAFRVFGDYFEPEVVAPYLKGLKRTGRALGPVRDLDVLREKTLAYFHSLPEPERVGLQRLLAAIEQHREAARERMLRHLDGDRYACFRERFGHFVHSEGMGSLPMDPGSGEPRPFRVRHVVPMAVYERLGAVRAYDEWVQVPEPPLERLHALRIACKRLRYTLEFFQEVLGPETRVAIKQVVAVQDHLGTLQDTVVARALLREFLATGSWGEQSKGAALGGPVAANPGVEAYLAARQAEMRHLVETFPQVWRQIISPDFSRRVAGIVAAL